MFSKSSKPARKSSGGNAARSLTVPSPAAPGVAPSIVSANLRVTGDLESDGDIQIDGAVDGDVRSTSVTVGEHAVVSGAIIADTVYVSGTVKGQIDGKLVELSRSAKVTGDIVHESLAIEAGAFIQGLCRHADGPAEKAEGGNGAPKPNLVVENGGADKAVESEAKKVKPTAIAAAAAKGEEAVKKVFR